MDIKCADAINCQFQVTPCEIQIKKKYIQIGKTKKNNNYGEKSGLRAVESRTQRQLVAVEQTQLLMILRQKIK